MYPICENTCTFTTTAMPRPELLEQTYESFTRCLADFDFKKATLYINVDPFPDKSSDDKRQEVVNVARRFFGNVIPNMPEVGNFANAVKWCFSNAKTQYCFHLEDDWLLLTTIKISLFNQFFLTPHVQQVGLRAWKYAKNNFWLSPSIMRGEFCRDIASKMNSDENPEEQIRNLMKNYKKEGFLYFPFDYKSVILKDLGRTWMRTQQFDRGLSNFTTWSIREVGKGIQKLADQNSQIPKEYFPNGINKRISMNNKLMMKQHNKGSIRMNKKGNMK